MHGSWDLWESYGKTPVMGLFNERGSKLFQSLHLLEIHLSQTLVKLGRGEAHKMSGMEEGRDLE